MKHTTSLALLISMLAMTAAYSVQTGAQSGFRDLNGAPVQLDTHIGNDRWLVVMIWASDCHICNAEAAAYEEFHRSRDEQPVGVLGISMDGEEKRAAARAFVERHGISYPNIIGEPGTVGLYYQSATGEPLRGTPTFLIYNPAGELEAAQAGAVPPESVERFIARKSGSQASEP